MRAQVGIVVARIHFLASMAGSVAALVTFPAVTRPGAVSQAVVAGGNGRALQALRQGKVSAFVNVLASLTTVAVTGIGGSDFTATMELSIKVCVQFAISTRAVRVKPAAVAFASETKRTRVPTCVLAFAVVALLALVARIDFFASAAALIGTFKAHAALAGPVALAIVMSARRRIVASCLAPSEPTFRALVAILAKVKIAHRDRLKACRAFALVITRSVRFGRRDWCKRLASGTSVASAIEIRLALGISSEALGTFFGALIDHFGSPVARVGILLARLHIFRNNLVALVARQRVGLARARVGNVVGTLANVTGPPLRLGICECGGTPILISTPKDAIKILFLDPPILSGAGAMVSAFFVHALGNTVGEYTSLWQVDFAELLTKVNMLFETTRAIINIGALAIGFHFFIAVVALTIKTLRIIGDFTRWEFIYTIAALDRFFTALDSFVIIADRLANHGSNPYGCQGTVTRVAIFTRT